MVRTAAASITRKVTPIARDTLNFGAYDKNNVLPYTINYTFNIQWQPRNDMAIQVGYTGNRGRHAVVPIPFNEPGIATPTNPIWGETASYGFEVLNQNSMSDGYDYDPIAGEPWNTEDGGNTDFRTPYIGFSPNAALFKTVGNSAYDALQTHVEKRLSTTSRPAPATPGATHSMSRATSASSLPATIPTICAVHGLRRTSTAPMSFTAQLPS